MAIELARIREISKRIHAGEKVRIGVVCVGNTCRSPAAEFFMRDFFHSRGFKNVEVLSSGLSASEGKPANSLTQEILLDKGHDGILDHKSRMLGSDAALKYDLLLFMDRPALEYFVQNHAGCVDNLSYRGLQRKAKEIAWTLKGFAKKQEWTWVFGNRNVIKDPIWLQTEQNYRKRLGEVERFCELAGHRLLAAAAPVKARRRA